MNKGLISSYSVEFYGKSRDNFPFNIYVTYLLLALYGKTFLSLIGVQVDKLCFFFGSWA
jgi:hypothetical protein